MEKARKTALEVEKEEDETQEESAAQQELINPFFPVYPATACSITGVWGNLASSRAPVIQE